MLPEENLYSGTNGLYNITEYLQSLKAPRQSPSNGVSGQPLPTTELQDLPMGTTYYDTFNSHPIGPHNVWQQNSSARGFDGFYPYSAAPSDAQYNESGDGSTYDGIAGVFAYPDYWNLHCPPFDPENPYQRSLISPQDVLGTPGHYTRLAESQNLRGYFPVLPAAQSATPQSREDARRYGAGEVSFRLQPEVSPAGSGATMRGPPGPQGRTSAKQENVTQLPRLEPPGDQLSYLLQNPAQGLTGELAHVGQPQANHILVFDPNFSLGFKSSYAPNKFEELQGAVVGVDAASYLLNLTRRGDEVETPPAHEALLLALGADPTTLKYHLELELDNWKANGMMPVFVFDGQSIVGKDEIDLRNARAALKNTENAWTIYANHLADEAVKTFGTSGSIRVQELFRILQDLLSERDMDYQIAPFSACAQLVYLLNTPDAAGHYYIDAVMGSRELLLYDTSPEATVINPPTAADWKNKEFSGTWRSEIMEKLGPIASDVLDDALLMVGTSFLPPFPPLLPTESIIPHQHYTLVDALNLLRTSEKSVTSMCAQFQDILDKRDKDWLKKYRKAKMGVKHAVVVKADGSVISRDHDNLTSDNTEYLGLQLPAELYQYLRRALIGPRIMNLFIHLESIVYPTLDGVVSDEYKKLVTQTLLPVKEATAALLASRMHRVYQNKNVTIKYWFDESQSQSLSPKSILAVPNSKADTWMVPDSIIQPLEKEVDIAAGSLSFALRSLQKDGVAPKTYTKVVKQKTPSKVKVHLQSRSEILSNALWRFLHLRGYINDQHQLTSWGKALAVTLQNVAPLIKRYRDVHQVEEACLLAFELVRFENLNDRNLHPELIGCPMRGEVEDKQNCILIARTACLLKFRHENVGYTGPLSKNLLAYNSIVKAVRETDRDLTEAVVATMFLDDQATRKKEHNYEDLGRSLPFAKAVNTIFGIAVLTYLDDWVKLSWTPEEREKKKIEFVSTNIRYSTNFSQDLEVAFSFFDAVYAGVKTLDNELSSTDKKAWDSAKAYLDKRR